jgi:hypothetical protein
VVLVRHREADLGDLGMPLEHAAAHVEQGRLQRGRVALGEGLEQQHPYALVHGVEVEGGTADDRRGVQRGRFVAPSRRDIGGQDAVGGLLQRRVPVAREPLESRFGRLQHGQAVESPEHVPLGTVGDDDGGAHHLPRSHERVVVG